MTGGSSMPETVVHAVSVGRAYGVGSAQVKAVTDATFSVDAGDTVALLGPSGSGKSTLLHLIAGLDAPTSGSIEWPTLGRREDLRPGPVAIAFQGPSLLPPLTVVENVALPALLAGRAEKAATAAATVLIDRLGLADVASKLPEQISGGQAQRAGLARALMGEAR